ncbi:MAG: polysaccharide deacetylase family protein [Hamadaea sp.]|nr:polysaccharide deacetylase family protein [Hamadaea sp.]
MTTKPEAQPKPSALGGQQLVNAAEVPDARQAPVRVAPIAPRRVPITGPNRPPLPREVKGGPFGTRVTTGFPDVALTFDDGPDPDWTPRILAQLRAYRIKATFCMIGLNAAQFPQLVRDIAADGHTLCNHSWSHDMGLGLRTAEWILQDMRRTNDAIRRAVPNAKISYYRQPGGAWTPGVVAAATRLGMSSLHWDVDPQDWRKPSASSISFTIISATRPGSIVLLHDGGGNRLGTATAMRSILPNLVGRFHLAALPPGVDPPRLFGRDLPLHAGQT